MIMKRIWIILIMKIFKYIYIYTIEINIQLKSITYTIEINIQLKLQSFDTRRMSKEIVNIKFFQYYFNKI